MRSTRYRRTMGLVVTAAIVGSGCGDGNGSSAGPERSAQPEPSLSPTPTPRFVPADEIADADLVLYTSEAPQGFDNGGYGFARGEVSSPGPKITLVAGEEVTLVLLNVSKEHLVHDFTVTERKQETAPALWGAQTEQIEPRESTLVSFTPQEPGTYFYICSLPTHTTGHGMWGRIVVEES